MNAVSNPIEIFCIQAMRTVLSLAFGRDSAEVASELRRLAAELSPEPTVPDSREGPPCLCPASSEYDDPCPRHGVVAIGRMGVDRPTPPASTPGFQEAAVDPAWRLPRDLLRTGVLAELEHEIRRLRANPCPTMRFGFSPDDIANAVRSEVDEVVAEPVGSQRAREEAAGVLAVAVHLAIVHGANVEDVIVDETRRLRRRLDHVQSGGTWAEAKLMERHDLLDPPLVIASTDGGSFWFNCEPQTPPPDPDDGDAWPLPRPGLVWWKHGMRWAVLDEAGFGRPGLWIDSKGDAQGRLSMSDPDADAIEAAIRARETAREAKERAT